MCAISPTVKQAQESKVNFLANNFSNMPCFVTCGTAHFFYLQYNPVKSDSQGTEKIGLT